MTPPDGLPLTSGALARVVAAPSYGQQDLGHAPGGAADRFAHWCANALLNQDRHTPAVEAIYAPGLSFTAAGLFVLTGAPRPHATRTPARGGPPQPVPHATVIAAEPGDSLTLGPAPRGLRTYLGWRQAPTPPGLVGRARPPFNTLCTTADPQGALRVTPGPEFHTLTDASALLHTPWRLSPVMSDTGLRLEPAHATAAPPTAQPPDITSGPVADGVVQLTAKGPLVLMRQRPTLGGYPRVATVIDVDIDRLAQHAPGHTVRFRQVSPAAAQALTQQRETDLRRLQKLST